MAEGTSATPAIIAYYFDRQLLSRSMAFCSQLLRTNSKYIHVLTRDCQRAIQPQHQN